MRRDIQTQIRFVNTAKQSGVWERRGGREGGSCLVTPGELFSHGHPMFQAPYQSWQPPSPGCSSCVWELREQIVLRNTGCALEMPQRGIGRGEMRAFPCFSVLIPPGWDSSCNSGSARYDSHLHLELSVNLVAFIKADCRTGSLLKGVKPMCYSAKVCVADFATSKPKNATWQGRFP